MGNYAVMQDSHHSISIISAPAEAGASCPGASAGPAVLRATGLPEELATLGYSIRGVESADGPVAPCGGETTLQKLDSAVACNRVIRDKAYQVLNCNSFPLVIGGDHSVSIGSIAAAAKYCEKISRPLSVIWFDAHADFNTFETTPTGNIHGMPAAVVAGFGHPALLAIGHRTPMVKTGNLYLVGVRSIDPAEQHLLWETDVQVFDMHSITQTGIKRIMQHILAETEQRNAWLHVSFDVDCLDPILAPGTGTKVNDGLGYEETRLCMELICGSGLMRSLDVVEFNPLLDIRNQTGIVTMELITALFGKRHPVS